MADTEVYDVIIVGAGPCGLATAARLREHTPAALFTDEEHRRFHWIGKYGDKVSLKHVRSGKTSSPRRGACRPEYKMMVLDGTDDKWLGRWNELFGLYDISHLRSPVLWHVDPLDRDSLLAHAYSEGREDELVEIRNCVGKEISKHARKKKKQKAGGRHCGKKQEARVAINLRDKNDYYTPSQSLFCDHCRCVATRYGLDRGLIRKEVLVDVDYGVVRGVSVQEQSLFTVTTRTGRRFHCKTLVLAVGAANEPDVPRMPSVPEGAGELGQACHSMQIKTFPDAVVRQRMAAGRRTHVLVVGGGLTSAQLSDLAIRRGVTKVWHMMRGPCRVKHFDVHLEWMGKYKNTEQARFWLADSDEERLAMIKAARGGGSITPLFNKRLRRHVAAGRLVLLERTRLLDATLVQAEDGAGGAWTVVTDPPVADMPSFDYIYFATGIQTDVSRLPYLKTMRDKHPIQTHGGLPCINDDLMWNDGVPLFLLGRLSALRLGPAAPNVGGAKLGAERVAWAIEASVKPSGGEEEEEEQEQDDGDGGVASYLSGHGNMYSVLAGDASSAA
ncbi:FAD binding domain protein [Metarhizium album ARSEF 1941]|uniref:FAD binding domain protein n=1 Tax=Metarhizium album (strain ARSEF 1941) TaxID=1081103 RepID=A0A0B2WEY6_METAS|nr:FAD binding domain protein [Metarhizium album ARSEF 1941]KHN94446.1 FAD binding domain protein [Metarhizium album ARSEF 1941]